MYRIKCCMLQTMMGTNSGEGSQGNWVVLVKKYFKEVLRLDLLFNNMLEGESKYYTTDKENDMKLKGK